MFGLTTPEVESAFNQVEWTPARVERFTNTVVNGNTYSYCFAGDGVSHSIPDCLADINHMPSIYYCMFIITYIYSPSSLSLSGS